MVLLHHQVTLMLLAMCDSEMDIVRIEDLEDLPPPSKDEHLSKVCRKRPSGSAYARLKTFGSRYDWPRVA